MTERAIAFVEEWVTDNVSAEQYPPGGQEIEAKALAQRCRTEASAAGIPASEIDGEFDDLAAFMSGQIEEANEREAHRLND